MLVLGFMIILVLRFMLFEHMLVYVQEAFPCPSDIADYGDHRMTEGILMMTVCHLEDLLAFVFYFSEIKR